MRCLFSRLAPIALLFSATPAPAEDFSVTAATTFETRYVVRGYQLAGASIQPTATVRYAGFYTTAWLNLPLEDDIAPNLFNLKELDLSVGYGAPVAERVTIDIGATYYTYPEIADGFFDVYREDKSGLGANTVEPFIGLIFDAPLSPKLYLYRDFMYDTLTTQAMVSHAIALGEHFGIELAGGVGYVIDDEADADYLYGLGAANLTYAISDNASAYAGGRFGGSTFWGGLTHDDPIAGTLKPSAFWFGAGLSATF